jgi:RHS repeat-associated protein
MNKSGIASQVIALPQGGGALRAIGETFSADAFTGTGNLTVPLSIPPGRNGFQPELNLSYSTGHGNGPFGVGWALSVPNVTRKTSRGVPRYRDHSTDPAERDTFMLSGADDLVVVAEPEPGVTRFRPRTEGMFARIERVQSNDADFWRVWSKDGLVSCYAGPTAEAHRDASLRDPSAPEKVFGWRLSETVDPFGNRVEYRYRRDVGDDGERSWDQLYLETIRYVDYDVEGGSRFLVSISLKYEHRPDPFSDRRSGFEVRTRLRCKSIEVRTHADRDRLVRTYELSYLDERIEAGELHTSLLPINGMSLLNQIRVLGHDDDLQEQLPPLEFGYTPFAPDARRVHQVRASSGALPAAGLGHPDFELVQLFGNGLPDIVQMADGGARFWRNVGDARFEGPHAMPELPGGVHLRDPGVQFADMNGNGRADLLVLPQGGYYPMSFEGRWSREGFVHYRRSPQVDFGDRNLRLVDLDGDGVTDALRTGTSFELFFNDGSSGWRERPETRERAALNVFPDVSFSNPRVKLADLTGDGLQDIVLVDQGRVDYWPYLGHGRWGHRITMRRSPVFRDAIGSPEEFDPRRVLFGDLDGDGLDDVAYVEPGRITLWINRGGDEWSAPIRIERTPNVVDADGVRLVDLLGTGQAGILWTFDRVAGEGSNFQFLELNGGLKPYLLSKRDNHCGAVTNVSYSPSTKFRLADAERPETRWTFPLPFPVQVVDRVEVVDAFSGNKLTSVYRYHHGYWDGSEREFRGFGCVDQLDTEVLESSSTALSPPLLTKNWFHLGAVGEESGARAEPDLSGEYWPGDPTFIPRPAATRELLDSLPASRRNDAYRALRGCAIRSEVYAMDGSEREDRPFTVKESQYGVREISRGTARSVFFPHIVAERTTEWERGDDPMTRFVFTDDAYYDEYGQPRRQVNVAVPRGRNYRTSAADAESYISTLTEVSRAQRDDAERYIVDRVASTTQMEVVNDGRASLLELHASIQAAEVELRVFQQSFQYYDGQPFVGLPFGELGDFGAAVRGESLVLTEELLAEALRDPNTPDQPSTPPYLHPTTLVPWTAEYPTTFQSTVPALAGYDFADGSDHRGRGYFTRSHSSVFDFQVPDAGARGLKLKTRDELGSEATISYDEPFRLLPQKVVDAVGLSTFAEYDYRVLKSRCVTDANYNRRAVTFSPLGLVTSIAVMGKEGEAVGDTLQIPGTRFEYMLLAFLKSRAPISVRKIVREHHSQATDLPGATQQDRDARLSATIESVEYSDGFGRLLQTRTQADDVQFGDEVFGGGVLSPDQNTTSRTIVGRRGSSTAPPVVVSGWQTYDNKGRVIEKFEPFFSTGFGYAKPETELGQKIRTFYDPRGQLIRTQNPDGSEQRTVFGIPVSLDAPDVFVPTPWEAFTYDANDLAPLTQGSDRDSLAERAPRTHHFTPSSIIVDGLGRIIEAIARNGAGLEAELRTRMRHDIRGNVLEVTDALGRPALRYTYDLANRPWRIASIDAGVRRLVLNALGQEVERRDGNGALILQTFDALNRPIRFWARDDADSSPTLRQRITYGDAGSTEQPEAERSTNRARNLLGVAHRHHDEAGLAVVDEVDFKGNVVSSSRHVIADAPLLQTFANQSAGEWQINPLQVDWEPGTGIGLSDLEGRMLEPQGYQTNASYDALGRVVRATFPKDVLGRRQELRPEYNRAGGLRRVWLGDTLYVERVAYDAKGQRALIAYGNQVLTRYAYDPRTFRLKRLRSERYRAAGDNAYEIAGEPLQDLAYEYDLAGNILTITDRTPACGVPNNANNASADPILAVLLARGDALIRYFAYDPVYRLKVATGRECDRAPDGSPWLDIPRCTDATRTRLYTEGYGYDAVGNMLRLEHRDSSGGFTRTFSVEGTSNRLLRLEVGEDAYDIEFDANGNQLSDSSARHFQWNHADQLKAFRTQTGTAEPSVHAQYLYDAQGQRVKKLVRKQGGQVEVTHYIGGAFEHHRWSGGTLSEGENNHLHVMDDTRRVAIVRTGPAHPGDRGPAQQYHLADHLGSSNVVLDADGGWINREEFTPYGETSFGSFAKKRYRFTAMERDEESGLAYHAARYYSPINCRWLAADPANAAPTKSAYEYSSSRPLNLVDPGGMDDTEPPLNTSGTAPNPVSQGEDLELYDRYRIAVNTPAPEGLSGAVLWFEPLTTNWWDPRKEANELYNACLGDFDCIRTSGAEAVANSMRAEHFASVAAEMDHYMYRELHDVHGSPDASNRGWSRGFNGSKTPRFVKNNITQVGNDFTFRKTTDAAQVEAVAEHAAANGATSIHILTNAHGNPGRRGQYELTEQDAGFQPPGEVYRTFYSQDAATQGRVMEQYPSCTVHLHDAVDPSEFNSFQDARFHSRAGTAGVCTIAGVCFSRKLPEP